MVVNELVTLLGLDVAKDAKSNAGKLDKMLTGITNTAKAAGAAVLGITASTVAVNQMTAQFDTLAQSVGLSTDELKAWEGVVAQAGFEADHVVDLVEELNNKVGESAGLGEQITPVKEAIAILGLAFEDVVSKSPEEQFRMIASAAKEMEDAQAAAAAADILLGGEANKIIGVLRQQEGSLNDVLNAQRAYNFLTEEGIQGAKESSKEFGILRRVAVSLGQDIAGKAGGGIAIATAALTDFIIANNEVIALGIGQLIDGISQGFTLFGDAVGLAYDSIVQFLPEMAFLSENLDLTQAIAITVAGALGVLTVAAATAVAPFVLLTAKITAAILVLEDLYTWFKGGDSIIKGWYESIVGYVTKAVDIIESSLPDWMQDFISGGDVNVNGGFDNSALLAEIPGAVAPVPSGMIAGGGAGNVTNNVTQNITGNDARAIGQEAANRSGLSQVPARYNYTRGGVQ